VKVTARAQRSGSWWAVDVPEVPGVFTQARRLDQVAAEVADAVAVMLDVDPSTVELDQLVVNLAADSKAAAALDATVAQARALARQAEDAQRAAGAAMRAAVATLRNKGLSVRDVGAVLGVSHQRVAQLEDVAQASQKEPATASRRKASNVVQMTRAGTGTRSSASKSGRSVVRSAAAASAAKRTPAKSKSAAKKSPAGSSALSRGKKK
jgi:predicted RNase H-like HicB family nuclease